MAGYCEVALPVPLRTTFTYGVPDALDDLVVPGARVVVPFRNRAIVGVVLERLSKPPTLSSQPASAKRVFKDVAEVLDPMAALPEHVLELGRWVARYYLAPVGETFRAMLPPAVELRVAREWQITCLGRAYLIELQSRSNRSAAEVDDLALLQLCEVQGQPIRGELIRRLPGGPAASARLLRRGRLAVREVGLRRPERTQKIVAWRSAPDSRPSDQVCPDQAQAAASATSREARVERVLAEERGPLPLTQLLTLARVSRAVIARLQRQGQVHVWEEPATTAVGPLEADFSPPSNMLNADQQRALTEIRTWLDARTFTTGLLFGVTGSGKTEVYLQAIESVLARNRTALVLVPEIALTLWVGRLCAARFGPALKATPGEISSSGAADGGVAILHSALSDRDRAREWWRVRRGEARVVVGTRSAVFAPLENLGLIIVDEEQESSYKQEETPRYHGRDVAVMRAKLEGAVALLASATPSLESFHHARQGKYELLRLDSRVANRPMAPVEIVDLREDFRQSHRAGPISERLRSAIAARLAAGTQTLVLINRRGYSFFALCRSCGAAILCENCSIALTYHKHQERLLCHYCGFSRRVPKACPKCHSEHVYFVGAGAEQIEERLRAFFPQARIARLDRDAVRSKRVFAQVLGAFSAGALDILVGTQMVAKGHDFQRVTLVGVAAADAQLAFPDFRAAERTFQLLTQVAGRAGRGALAGEVLIETYYPEHYAIQLAARQDYPCFFEKELHFRRLLHYPPFAALASLLVRDTKLEQAIRWSRQLGSFLAPMESRGIKVLGPAAAPLARLKREYRFQFLFKSPRRSTLNRVLAESLAFCAEQGIPDRAILLDIDPVNLL
jgi:primosomal protein N' (replication factor Y) (superfamily II helicase)